MEAEEHEGLQARPDLEELLQVEEHVLAVPVRQDGPVNTRELPALKGAMFSTTVGTTVEPLLGRDLRRKAVYLISLDQPVYVGTDRTMVAGGSAARWPINVPLSIVHAEPIFIRAVSSTTTVSVVSATGE